jgi:hypothetical protein
LALHCGLEILFLRKENPGRLVHQRGTLFDALSVSNIDQIVDDASNAAPICCLSENNRIISGVFAK